MSSNTKEVNPKLMPCSVRVILSMVNDVRLGRRKAVQFVGDGEGGLEEMFTSMQIHNDPDKIESDKGKKS